MSQYHERYNEGVFNGKKKGMPRGQGGVGTRDAAHNSNHSSAGTHTTRLPPPSLDHLYRPSLSISLSHASLRLFPCSLVPLFYT